MKLTTVTTLTGTIEVLTGLHIGSGDAEMHIGGTDNPVIKNPLTDEPYIPGSSIKGRMRSLLEWYAGVVSITNGAPLGLEDLERLESNQLARDILKLFGYAPKSTPDSEEAKLVREIGPSRLAFWDCPLNAEWASGIRDRNLMLTEVKMENSINRIQGVADHPRNMERVPAGARFDFRLTIKVLDDEDLTDLVLKGLKLIEMTGLGGSLSRGYGKVAFTDLKQDGTSLEERYQAVTL